MIIPTIVLEEELWSNGLLHIAGVDEAGKGPLAGPVTAGAVMIHSPSEVVESVRDSKLMSAKQREKAYTEICNKSSAFGVGVVSEKEIDTIGIDAAVKKAMLLALTQVEKMAGVTLSMVLVDGSKTKPLEIFPSKRILKGGLYHYSIAAGSILAKVTRDTLMKQLDTDYPEYGFARHVGYGTKSHIDAIKRFGPCPIHRKTFEPIKSFLRYSV